MKLEHPVAFFPVVVQNPLYKHPLNGFREICGPTDMTSGSGTLWQGGKALRSKGPENEFPKASGGGAVL